LSGTVLSISSQVAFGPVGNSATAPALESLGFTVIEVPTTILSFHPGHGKPAGLKVPARDMTAIFTALSEKGMLENCAGIFTGYFAAPEQVAATAQIIRTLKKMRPAPCYFCDPVMGDDPGGLYAPIEVAEAIHKELIPLADCIAPNRFELFWLAGEHVRDEAEATAAARSLKVAEVLATSIPAGDAIATLAIFKDEAHAHVTPRLSGVPHGTGDLLSGLYLGHRLLHLPPAAALEAAMARLAKVIAASAGSSALDLRAGFA
jgi:pyridoxine kinase